MAGEASPAAVWKLAEHAVVSGDATMLEGLLRDHEQSLRHERPQSSWLGGLTPDYSAPDARSIIVSSHHFENWNQFQAFTEALNDRNSAVAQFEAAADAVVAGDVTTLERLLRQNPALIGARSTRKHRSTLLHYVGANGVEGFRQRTPKNAVRIAETLLAAGAEVDAVADMYRGTTTLGLVATSIHPAQAAVLEVLIDTLLAHGASLDRAVARDYTGGRVVNACLHNGRPEGAEYLARRGAPLDLEAAAGVGRLDVVKSFFNEDGSLKSIATRAQLMDGVAFACGLGRIDVVDFLLERGVEVGTRLGKYGATALHHAAYGGQRTVVETLLKRNAAVDVRDETFAGTPLDWALHGWGGNPDGVRASRYYDVVALLVSAGAPVDPEWLASLQRGFPLAEKIAGDPRMIAALTGATGKV